MKLSTAVALRISNILREKNMSQYRLEKDIAMPHNTMKTLMGERNSGVNLKTVMQINGAVIFQTEKNISAETIQKCA